MNARRLRRWLSLIDLPEAHIHVVIHLDHMQFQRVALEGRLYKYLILPVFH